MRPVPHVTTVLDELRDHADALAEACQAMADEDSGLMAAESAQSALTDYAAWLVTGRSRWRPMSEARKTMLIMVNRAPIWAKIRDDLYPAVEPRRPDLAQWNGVQLSIRRYGEAVGSDLDMGWVMAAPVGHGGFPDEWFEGWRPLP